MGTEQYWHGILGHSGNPGRTYREAKQLVHTFAKHMDAFEGTMPNPEVAIVHSFRQNYAFDVQPNHSELSYVGQLQKYYKALYEKKIPVDFVQGMDDLSKYKLVIAPLQYLMLRSLEKVVAKDVFDAAKNGDKLALEVLEQVYAYMGEFIANICCVVNPEVVVLGGGVSRAGDPLLEGVKRHFKKWGYHACQDTQFRLATLGNDAGAYGAFKLVAE